jgi:hypothetical protein
MKKMIMPDAQGLFFGGRRRTQDLRRFIFLRYVQNNSAVSVEKLIVRALKHPISANSRRW